MTSARRRAAWLAGAWLAAAPPASAGESAGAGTELAPPTIEIRVSRDGFQPSEVRLRKDETVRLAIRSEDEEHCFAVDALRIEKRVRPGRVTRVELTPERAGRFVFYCCLESGANRLTGTLVVSE